MTALACLALAAFAMAVGFCVFSTIRAERHRLSLLGGPRHTVVEPSRVLDEIADVLRAFSGVEVLSLELADHFRPLNPETWASVGERLGCRLPALQPINSGWNLPAECRTIEALAQHVASCHPEWTPPVAVTVKDWREARIFVVVRQIIMDMMSIPRQEIMRSSRFVEDLGMD